MARQKLRLGKARGSGARVSSYSAVTPATPLQVQVATTAAVVTVHYMTQTYTLAAGERLDIGDDAYYPATGFTGNMFDCSADNCKLFSSTGNGTIDGSNVATGFITTTVTTDNVEIYGITFSNAKDCKLYGGSRALQTGGANNLHDCTFFATRLIFAGLNHTLTNLTFDSSIAEALRMGDGTLGTTDAIWSRNSCSGIVISHITFTNCYTSGTQSTDDGVFYMGRRLTSSCTVSYVTFIDCPRAVSFYLDDGMSHVTASHFTFIRSARDYLIAGGVNIHLIDFRSYDAALASVWDDRFSIQNVTGGAYGSHYSNGAWHAMFQGGDSHTHGALTCDANTGGGKATFVQEHDLVVANPAYLAHADELFAWWGGYVEFWADEANYTTRGSVEYTRSGTTPAPTYNASSSTPPTYVIVAGAQA